MPIPTDLKYTASHEWVRLETDGRVTVGITDHAQELLGDMVFVETPTVGRTLAAGEECAVVESVKAASDVYAPIAGTVVEVNDLLDAEPQALNADAFGNWMFRLQPANAADLAALMDAVAYQSAVDAEAH